MRENLLGRRFRYVRARDPQEHPTDQRFLNREGEIVGVLNGTNNFFFLLLMFDDGELLDLSIPNQINIISDLPKSRPEWDNHLLRRN